MIVETREEVKAPAAAKPRSWRWAPWAFLAAFVAAWSLAPGIPTPWIVAKAAVEEKARLLDDVVASLFRVSVGFTLAALAGVPLGLVLGRSAAARATFLPAVNFLRSISPIAWIPFAILWFGVGDLPAIFLIFLASFLPLALSTTAAAAAIPQVYFRVARDYGVPLRRIVFPAVLPELVTALRVSAGVSWLVVVAAEMIAVRSGLGFLILDARNGLRMDLVVLGMVLIGAIGIALDRVIAQLARIRSVRWGFER